MQYRHRAYILAASSLFLVWGCYSSIAATPKIDPGGSSSSSGETSSGATSSGTVVEGCEPRKPWQGPGVTGFLPVAANEAVILSGDRYYVAVIDVRGGDAANPLIGRVDSWKESGHIKEYWGDAPQHEGFNMWDDRGVTATYTMKRTNEQVIISRFRRWVRAGTAWAEPANVTNDWILNDAGPLTQDGEAPWTGPSGVTATWFTPDGNMFCVVNGGKGWRRITTAPDPGNWSWSTGDGGVFNLMDDGFWKDAPAVGGVKPWDGTGVSAAWYVGQKFFVVNKDIMWTHDGRGWTSAGKLETTSGWSTAPNAECPAE